MSPSSLCILLRILLGTEGKLKEGKTCDHNGIKSRCVPTWLEGETRALFLDPTRSYSSSQTLNCHNNIMREKIACSFCPTVHHAGKSYLHTYALPSGSK